MKIKTSQISIRKIGLIVPVLAYFLINGVFTMLTTLSARIFSLQSFASSVGQTIPYLSIFTVTCSYLSCHLYTKKKVWGYYGFILSFAFISLFYYLKSDNDYGIMLWVISYFLYSSVTGILLYILYDWFQKKEKQKELKRQNLQSELNLLKNQLNPHFLFNTLNNIDSLICSYPEKASKSLVQMSEMMRSMRPILPKLISHKSLNTSTITLTCNNYNMIIRIWYHIGWKDHQIIFVSLLCCSSHLLKMPSSIVRIRKLLKLSACFFRFRNPRYILKYSICSIRQSKSTKIPPAVSG